MYSRRIAVRGNFIMNLESMSKAETDIVFTFSAEAGQRTADCFFEIDGDVRSMAHTFECALLQRFANELFDMYSREHGSAHLVDTDEMHADVRVETSAERYTSLPLLSAVWRYGYREMGPRNRNNGPNIDPGVFHEMNSVQVVAVQGVELTLDEVLAFSSELKVFVEESGVSTLRLDEIDPSEALELKKRSRRPK